MSEIIIPRKTEIISDLGEDGLVYKLNESLAIKIYREENPSENCLNEHKIASLAFQSGIRVPRPYGLFNVTLEDSNQERKGFVMDYLNGFNLFEFSIKARSHEEINKLNILSKEYKNELRNAEDLGFIIKDVSLQNAIYNLEEDLVYLIDFCDWETPKHFNISIPQ